MELDAAVFIALSLYIPFWIYSNKTKRCNRKSCRKLYIPFWIYSNCTPAYKLFTPICFTFHSGYIPIYSSSHLFESIVLPLHSILDIFQLSKAKSRDTELKSFTFHSGYIPITINAYLQGAYLTLHSILDIFQLIKIFFIYIISPPLYIPFWIYSNQLNLIKLQQVILLYIPFWIYSNLPR